jgi:small redox-active disulfide protein 2
MVRIKLLGFDCGACNRLDDLVQRVVTEHHIEAEIEKITDLDEILQWQVVVIPGLVVNDQVVSTGRIPSEVEILRWLAA